MLRKPISLILCLTIAISTLLSLTGCQLRQKPKDLTANLPTGDVISLKTLEPDTQFANSCMSFALSLLRGTGAGKDNVLLSPLSIQMAMAMATNGAAGDTQQQLLELLCGELTLEQLNGYLKGYVDALSGGQGGTLHLANSIWLRDDEQRLQVRQEFLQCGADIFGAQVFRAPFDGGTVKDVNSWVKKQTDGMIDKLLEKIDGDTVMLLINALAFEAAWETVYENSDVSGGTFTTADGRRQKVDTLCSTEDRYLSDGLATGFIKPYAGGAYSFVAMLPNEGVSLDEYIASLTAEELLSTLHGAPPDRVRVFMPKFTVSYSAELSGILSNLGAADAFDSSKADFSAMATSSRGNIFIGRVLHKSFIRVDQKGTQAGAVTDVEMNDACIGETGQGRTLRLDRPFLYMIVDNATGLPIFIGTLTDVAAE